MTLVRNDPFLSSAPFFVSNGGSPRPYVHKHSHTRHSSGSFSTL